MNLIQHPKPMLRLTLPSSTRRNWWKLIQSGPISIVGSDNEGEIRVLEYPGHSFFIGTLFVPQALSTEKNPHPLVTGFLQAIMKNKIAEQASAPDAKSPGI